MGGLISGFVGSVEDSGAIGDAAVEVGDTAVDLAWSGHSHDEIDLLGPSLGNPQDEFFEDNIPVRDDETGDIIGVTNTPDAPSGARGEPEDSGGDGSGADYTPEGQGNGQVILWVVLLIAGLYAAGQVFDVDLGGSA
ncbi:hypothetical protein [Halorientalis halophila]|uniref:hypothetical protein n=1 Tax=Halorientalis halophila TaxID=3108499 RepID=UPI00300BC5B4